MSKAVYTESILDELPAIELFYFLGISNSTMAEAK